MGATEARTVVGGVTLTEAQEKLLAMEWAWLLLHFVTHERAEGEHCRFCDVAYRVLMPPEITEEMPDHGRMGPTKFTDEQKELVVLTAVTRFLRAGGTVPELLTHLDRCGEVAAIDLFFEYAEPDHG